MSERHGSTGCALDFGIVSGKGGGEDVALIVKNDSAAPLLHVLQLLNECGVSSVHFCADASARRRNKRAIRT